MAHVPLTITPDVPIPDRPPPDYTDIQSSPADFGGLVGPAEQKAGEQGQQAGSNLADAALVLQGRHNQVVSDSAINQLMDQTRGIVSNFRSLNGADAGNARAAAMQALDDARTSIRGNLQNPAQQLEYDDQSRRYQNYANGDIDNHAIQQAQVYHLDVAKAGMSNALQDIMATPYDDVKFMNSVAGGANRAGKVADSLAGATADPAVRQSHVQAWVAEAVKTRALALMPTDPTRAAAFVEAQRSNLAPEVYASLSREAQTRGDTAFANAYVNGLLTRGGASPSAAPTAAPGAPAGAAAATGGISAAINAQEGAGAARDVSGAEIPGGAVDGIVPGTFKQYAQPGESFDNAADRSTVKGRVITDLAQKFNNDPARIAVGYFSGPGNVAPAGSPTPWVQDKADANGKSTSSYVSDVLGRLGSGVAGAPGSSPAYPDESALVKQALTDTAGMPAERQAKVLSQLTRQLSLVRLATDTDRSDLQKSLPDLQAAALGGQDITIPEARIRSLLPPADAARELENLSVAQQAGQVFKSIQWGTPDQVAAARQDLSSGMGPISAMIRAKGQPTTPAGAAAPGSGQDTPEAYRLRTTILRQFEQQVQVRDAALANDPAGYVQAAPGVAAAAAAVKAAPGDPAALARYVTATQAVQTSLGVPEVQQHILTAADAKAQAQKLTSIDPSKGDVGQALAGVAQQYGAAWPKAFGDLVTLGKLPGDYQVLAAMPDPVARTDFQRALAAVSAKGGVEQLKGDVPPQAVKDIDTGLDDKLADFRRSASVPGLSSNVALISTVRDSIKTLAYFYAVQGGDGPKALDRAYDAVIGSKYDFGGTMRVPKGMLPAAETATANVQANLKPADMLPLAADTMATPSGPGMTVAQRQAVTLAAAQRGSWVPTERDDGLVLVGKLLNGAFVQMRRTDGSRIEVPFKGMAAPAGNAVGPAGPGVAPPFGGQ